MTTTYHASPKRVHEQRLYIAGWERQQRADRIRRIAANVLAFVVMIGFSAVFVVAYAIVFGK